MPTPVRVTGNPHNVAGCQPVPVVLTYEALQRLSRLGLRHGYGSPGREAETRGPGRLGHDDRGCGDYLRRGRPLSQETRTRATNHRPNPMRRLCHKAGWSPTATQVRVRLCRQRSDTRHRVPSGAVGDPASEIHELLLPIAFLVGQWKGRGEGRWAGGFPFEDSMSFLHDGRPALRYEQLTTGPDGRPSHAECGFFVAQENGDIHVTLAEPSGITEVLVGRSEPAQLVLTSVEIGHTPTTDNVTSCRRILRIEDGALLAEVEIAVNGEKLAPHTSSRLQRLA